MLAKGGEPEPEEQRSREPSCTDGKQSAFRRQPPLSAQDRLGMLGKCPANPPLEQRKKWPSHLRLSKNPGVDQGPQPLMFHPALTTSASERRKTRRLSYVAGFAARERMREAKPVKARKSGVQPLFRYSDGADVSSAPRCMQGEKTLALTCCAGKRARPACSSAARDSPGAGRPG